MEEVVFEGVVEEDRVDAEEEDEEEGGALEGVGEVEEDEEGTDTEGRTKEEEGGTLIVGVESISLMVCRAVAVQYLDRCRTSRALSEVKCVSLHMLTGTHTRLLSCPSDTSTHLTH